MHLIEHGQHRRREMRENLEGFFCLLFFGSQQWKHATTVPMKCKLNMYIWTYLGTDVYYSLLVYVSLNPKTRRDWFTIHVLIVVKNYVSQLIEAHLCVFNGVFFKIRNKGWKVDSHVSAHILRCEGYIAAQRLLEHNNTDKYSLLLSTVIHSALYAGCQRKH